MDPQTIKFYESQAQSVASRYEAADSPVEAYFSIAFPPGSRVVYVGCGSGRDAARLLGHGYDAFGIEPSSGLRAAALASHPELSGRIVNGALPELGEAFGGGFDGVLCSAVLMHVPDAELLDAALSLRKLLKPRGRLMLSLPASRGETMVEDRDANGRLFSPYTAEAIALLFERLGFQSIGRWLTSDHLGRSGTTWYTLLLELRHAGLQRPIDQIEAILNRYRKEATYKLALFRAMAAVATQEARSAVW
jgi:SAM-dependent methyltransferase